MTDKRTLPFDILDSIRGLAALYVAIAHCRGILWLGGTEYTRLYPRSTWGLPDYVVMGSSMLTRLAVEFVIVFFVLSGFSIAHSLASSPAASEFYRRRFVRIYPPYVAALVWAGVVFLITKQLFPAWYDGSMHDLAFMRTVQMNDYFSLRVVVKNLVYLPSQGFITPFWSLTYEVIFYLLAPLLVRQPGAYLSFSIVLLLVRLVAPNFTSALGLPAYLHDFLFVYGIYFAIGVGLYTYLPAIQRAYSKLQRSAARAIVLALLCAMYAANFTRHGESTEGFVASALFSVALLLYFLRYSVRIAPLIRIGEFSYTLYISHVASVYVYLAVYWAIARPTTQLITSYYVWPPAVAFVLIVAALQYSLVEKHTKRMLNSLRAKTSPYRPK